MTRSFRSLSPITDAEIQRHRGVRAWRGIANSVFAFGVLSGCAFDSEGLGPGSLGTGGSAIPQIQTTNGGTRSVSSRAPIPVDSDGGKDGDDAAIGGNANPPASSSSSSTSTSSEDLGSTNDVGTNVDHTFRGGEGGEGGDSGSPQSSASGGLDRDPSEFGGSAATDDTTASGSGGSTKTTKTTAAGGGSAADGTGGRVSKAEGGNSSSAAGGTTSKRKSTTSTASGGKGPVANTTSEGGSRWTSPTIPPRPW